MLLHTLLLVGDNTINWWVQSDLSHIVYGEDRKLVKVCDAVYDAFKTLGLPDLQVQFHATERCVANVEVPTCLS